MQVFAGAGARHSIFTVKYTAWANSHPASTYSRYCPADTPRTSASTITTPVTAQVSQVIK